MNQTSIKNTQGKGIKLFKWNTAYCKRIKNHFRTLWTIRTARL